MRRTIRKTFLLEGETVTMKYVKMLCGEERYSRMIEDAKKKFFADPTVDLCYPTPAGALFKKFCNRDFCDEVRDFKIPEPEAVAS